MSDDPRWTPCVICKHLRIEHAVNGKKCEVRTQDEHNPDGRRCDCTSFRAPRGGVRQ